MKKCILLSFLLLSCYLSTSQSEVKTTTNISAVKIFIKGANVTRNATIDLPQGKSTVVIGKLPGGMEFNSVRLSFGDQVTIDNIRYDVNYLTDHQEVGNARSLIAKSDSLETEITDFDIRLNLVKEKMKLIKMNSNPKETSTNLVEDIKSLLSLYDDELLRLKKEEATLIEGIDRRDKAFNKIQLELDKIKAENDAPLHEIIVEVTAQKALRCDLELEYYTPHAAWFPKYNARVSGVNQPLKLDLKAMIIQSTPEKWRDVEVILSNVQPNNEGTFPTLKKWELTYKRFTRTRPIFENSSVSTISGFVSDGDGVPLIGATVSVPGSTIGTVTDFDGRYEISLPTGQTSITCSYVGYQTQTLPALSNTINFVMEESAELLDEVVVTGYTSQLQSRMTGVSVESKKMPEFAEVDEKFNAIEYRIVENQNISNEGSPKLIDVQQYELDATYEYHAVPKLRPDVYLVALVSNWDEYYFLNGEMSIFYENAYVGKSLLETNVYSDTLSLSLGKDYNVAIERKGIKSSSKRQFFGSNKVVDKAFEIKVHNRKNETINLFIHDQIAVSIIKNIEVEILELGGAKLTAEDGKLVWQKDILPKAIDEIQFVYRVKYPKSEEVILE